MQNKNIIINSLRLIKQCPVCNTKYTTSRAEIVEHTDAGVLLFFSCPVCYSSLLAQIIEMPFGLVGSAMLTDLEVSEVAKFKNAQPVSVDDVLKIYQILEEK